MIQPESLSSVNNEVGPSLYSRDGLQSTLSPVEKKDLTMSMRTGQFGPLPNRPPRISALGKSAPRLKKIKCDK